MIYYKHRESHVCSYQHAVRFKELGLLQESLYCYSEPKPIVAIQLHNTEPKVIKGDLYGGWAGYEHYSCYTLNELAAMIGKGTREAVEYYRCVQRAMDSGHSFTVCLDIEFLSDCVLGMIVNGVLSVEDANKRLTEMQFQKQPNS